MWHVVLKQHVLGSVSSMRMVWRVISVLLAHMCKFHHLLSTHARTHPHSYYLCRYQSNGDKLQLENIRLIEDLDIQKLNLRDINEFLTNELKV